MSRLKTYFVNVQSGADIAETLRNFTVKHKLEAAFVVHCVGQVSKAKIRLAEAVPGFEPVKDIVGPAQINSFVGTLSAGGHLHISVVDKHNKSIGGHLFGPLLALGTVEATIGNCIDLSFVRLHDTRTGYQELSVTNKNSVEAENQSTDQELIDTITYPNSKMADTPYAGSSMRVFALRLGPGEEIVTSLKSLVAKENLKAAFIITCVGSVMKAKLRLAHKPSGNEITNLEGFYEIVSLVGTLADGAHLHISLSDKDGQVIGGHVLGDLVVFTTAELVVGECTDYQMTREMDSKTGFPEYKKC